MRRKLPSPALCLFLRDATNVAKLNTLPKKIRPPKIAVPTEIWSMSILVFYVVRAS